MLLINTLSKERLQKCRQRSQKAINGLKYAIENAKYIAQLKTINEKWEYIADCMGLVQERGNSRYNYFAPINRNIIFMLRNSNHNNTNATLYNIHEQNGRPNKRFVVSFKKGNIFADNAVDFLESEHHTVSYNVDALDSIDGIIQYCQANIDLFTNGEATFPTLPINNTI